VADFELGLAFPNSSHPNCESHRIAGLVVELLRQRGGHVWVADAPNWTDDRTKTHLTIAVSFQGIRSRADRGIRWALGQMYGVLAPGLILAEYVFEGLRRDMYVREDMNAAKHKLAVSWAAKRDAELVGDSFAPTLRFVEVPANRVFVVYISPNEMLTEFPDVYGWAEHWAWVGADADLPGAPVDWNTRYDRKIWSSGGR
jgi:hypothetical protein